MPCPSWAKTMGERARQCFCTFPLFSTFYPFLILARKERNHKFKLGTAIHMAFPCTNSKNSARHPQQYFLWLLLFCSSLYFLVASAMQPKEASVVITPNEPKLEAALGLAIAAEQQQQKQSGEGRKCEIKVQIVKQVRGECVRLFGGKPACQSEEYIDPESAQCRDEELLFL